MSAIDSFFSVSLEAQILIVFVTFLFYATLKISVASNTTNTRLVEKFSHGIVLYFLILDRENLGQIMSWKLSDKTFWYSVLVVRILCMSSCVDLLVSRRLSTSSIVGGRGVIRCLGCVKN